MTPAAPGLEPEPSRRHGSERGDALARLLALPQSWDAAVSPDGRWVAWTWFGKHPTAEAYVAPTDGSARPLRLTETPDHAMVVSWARDSRTLVVGRERDGDERIRLFAARIDDPSSVRRLTEENPNHYVIGGQLHPDGRRLVYAANVDAATGREIPSAWIYRHDLETGERRPLARPRRACFSPPALNRMGAHILYQRNDASLSGRQLWLVDIEGTEDREALDLGDDVKLSGSWCPDGRRLVVLAEKATHVGLGLWDPSGAVAWLIDDPAHAIEAAWWPEGSERIVVLMVSQARTRAVLLDPRSGAAETVARDGGTLVPLAPAADGSWIGRWYAARQPEEIVRFRPDRPSAIESLTHAWEQAPVAPPQLAAPEAFRWRSVDGLPIQGWLYRAEPPAKGAVVCVHGGPTAHSEDRFHSLIQYLVSLGFNVLDPNYRGSTGFGVAFSELIKVDGWGGREQEDIRTGIAALLAAGLAEPRRVGITGVSYGGYCAWWAITHFPPEIVAAAAPICGMTDLAVDYATTRPDLAVYSEEMIGGAPGEAPQRYRERSPVNDVANIRGRLLIVQGQRDPNVTPSNLAVARAALDAAAIPYEVLAFADEGHGIYRTPNRAILYRRLAAFFAAAFAAIGDP